MIAPPKPPSHDEIEALIREARERQLRRRLLGAAGIAIAAAIALGAYALTFGRTQQSATSNSPPTSVAACRSSQLSATAGLNGAAGSILGPVTITRSGGATCSLPDRPPVVRITAAGGSAAVQQRPLSLPVDLAPRLARGAIAEIFIQWSNWCGKTPTAMTLDFGQGLEVTTPLRDTQPPCRAPAVPSAIGASRPLTPS
jgi:hypothetical protein